MYAAAAVCGLTMGGCGGGDNAPKPPSGAVTDTPMIDIDEGIEASPDEVAPIPDGDTKPAETAK
jgi:hypothetical protein